MKKIKLIKPWNKHHKGVALEVDDVRAAYLLKHGYIESKKGKEKT